MSPVPESVAQPPDGVFDIPRELIDDIRNSRCVLFLGAAVHAPPPDGSSYVYPAEHRPAMVRQLTNELAEQMGYEKRFPRDKYPMDYPLSLSRVAFATETHDGRSILVDRLRKATATDKRPSPALMALASLPFHIYVTTNYDPLLEQALRLRGREPVVLVYDPDSSHRNQDMRGDPTVERPLVFKIHGDIEQPRSIVITDEDYITFVQRMSDKPTIQPVSQTVLYRMGKWKTLFLGYSLRDFNLRLLFRTLRFRLDQADIPACFSVDRGPDPLVQVLWEREKWVRFVVEDLWRFVPLLYHEVTGQDMPERLV